MTATRLCFGDDAIWVGTRSVVAVPDDSIRSCLDCIDDDYLLVGGHVVATVDVLAAAVQRAIETATGGPVFVDDLTIVHPSHWGGTRIRVLESAARRCARDVTVVPTAEAAPGPANAARWVVLELSPLSTAATLVERGLDGSPTIVACEFAPETGSLDVREDPGRVTVLDGLVGAVSGERRVDAVLVTGAEDPAVHRHLTAGITSAVIVPAEDVLRADLAPASEPPGFADVAVPWADPAPSSRLPLPTRRRRLPLLMAAAVLVAAAAAVGAAVVFLPGLGPTTAPAADALQHFEIGSVRIDLPGGWMSRSTKPGRLDLTPDGADGRRIVVIPTAVGAGSDRAAVARALEQRILDRGPDGPFSDFDPAAEFAGRVSVSYLESPDDRSRVRWHVLVENDTQVSVGCQFRDGDWDALARDCALAVGSVAVGAS